MYCRYNDTYVLLTGIRMNGMKNIDNHKNLVRGYWTHTIYSDFSNLPTAERGNLLGLC